MAPKKVVDLGKALTEVAETGQMLLHRPSGEQRLKDMGVIVPAGSCSPAASQLVCRSSVTCSIETVAEVPSSP